MRDHLVHLIWLFGTVILVLLLVLVAGAAPATKAQATYLQMETLEWSLSEGTLTFTVSEWTQAADGTYQQGIVREPYVVNLDTYLVRHLGRDSRFPIEEAEHLILLLMNLNDETTSMARWLSEQSATPSPQPDLN